MTSCDITTTFKSVSHIGNTLLNSLDLKKNIKFTDWSFPYTDIVDMRTILPMISKI